LVLRVRHASMHGWQFAELACFSISEAKLSSFFLEGFVDKPALRQLATSALDNRTDPPFRSLRLIDHLLPLPRQAIHGILDIPHPGIQFQVLLGFEVRLEGLHYPFKGLGNPPGCSQKPEKGHDRHQSHTPDYGESCPVCQEESTD
jgi:hypothetical protein